MQRVFEIILMIITLLILIALSPFLAPVIVWFAIYGARTPEAYTKVNEPWTPTDLANSPS